MSLRLDNSADLKKVRNIISKALEEHGLKASMPRMTYDLSGTQAWGKLTITATEVDGEQVDAEKVAWDRHFGDFDPDGVKDCYGKTYQHCGTPVVVCGVRPRSRKYPILARNLRDGKTYKYSMATLKAWVALAKVHADGQSK